MTAKLHTIIEYPIDQLLPETALLDEFHPANDEYLRKQVQLERMMVNAEQCMRPKHVQIAKLRFNGMTNIAIAEDMRMHPGSISIICNRKDVQQLTALMRHYRMGRQGPNEDQRIAMLWRIAVRNEEERPSIAKDALAELNRMHSTAADRDMALKQIGGSKIEITINQTTMPRGALDK